MESPKTSRRRTVRVDNPVVIRLLGSSLSGLALYLAFDPAGLWWMGPLGLAGLATVLHRRKAWAAFGYAFVMGLSMTLPLLWWTGEFVGPVASVPLAVSQALLIAAAGPAIVAVARLRGGPVWAACVWVADESVRSHIPFGGFPWTKIAFSQVDGWYAPMLAVGGTPWVAFLVSLTGFALTGLLISMTQSGTTAQRATAASLAVVPLLGALLAQPLVEQDAEAGEVTVALVQGNVPRPGLDFNAERRRVLDNHVKETVKLAASVRAGRQPQPDVVIWPENSSDIDPYANADASAAIQRATDTIGAPITVGGVVGGTGPRPRNSVILWNPGTGPSQEYTKRKLQPFGETMPLRSFFRVFTDKVDRAGRFVPGNDATVLSIGHIRLGLALCYEVAFDATVRESVLNGANLLAVPSNNATFGYTNMTYQQLAMDRARAIEHGRAVVVATTSGVSAIVSPDGEVAQRTGMFVPATITQTVPLRTTLTVADRMGDWPERVLTGLAVMAFAVAMIASRRRHARFR